MKLLKVQLKNIQLHEFFELEFQSGLNVISGLSGTGKTGLYRGICWCLGFSDISFDDIRTEGKTECSVKLWLDNGFQIERYRNTSGTNSYILSKEGCDDKIFDSVGKTLPEDIQQIIGMSEIEVEDTKINLNFASQDDLNFLFDKGIKSTFRAKLFNKLIGQEKMDEVFKECNKDALRTSKEIKEVESDLEKKENELSECLDLYKQSKDKLDTVLPKWNKLQEDIKIYEVMKDLADKIKSNKEAQEFVAFKISQIKVVADDKIKELKQKAEELIYVKELTNKLSLVHNKIIDNQCQIDKLKIVDVDFGVLKSEAQTLQTMKDLSNKLSEIKKKQLSNTEDMRRIEEAIAAGEKELKKVWCDCKGICPLCKGKKNE
jgi:DNA repair exonuclease SbcCD ATPase subunit